MNINNISNYFSPFSNEFNQATSNFNKNLSGRQKTAAISAAVFAGIFSLGTCSFAAFRLTVEQLEKGSSKVADNVDQTAITIFQQNESDIEQITVGHDEKDYLKFLKSYFLSKNGQRYENSKPLKLNGFCVWYSSFNEKGKHLFILNIQQENAWKNRTQQQKLEISINNEGEVNGVYIDGCPMDPLEIFQADHPWKQQLVKILNIFLQQKATKKETRFGQKILTTHRVVIARQPEFILSQVQEKQKYQFYNDQLNIQPGHDTGGLTRQFFSELALHLFEGSSERIIKVEEGIPVLSRNVTDEERELLTNIGRTLFYPCFIKKEYTLGQILDDSFFDLLHYLFSHQDLDDNTMVAASRLLCSNEQLNWLFEVYQKPRPLSANEVSMLTDTLGVIDVDKGDKVPTDLKEIQRVIKETVIDDLSYGNKVRAAHLISEGMLQATTNDYDSLILTTTPAVDLKYAIQGIDLNPENIANRIYTHSDHPVVIQKTQWLKEYILESRKDEIAKFLITVTGSPTVTAATRIRIKETDGHNCIAHTCFKSLDVPRVHTSVGTDAGQNQSDKQKFINNLRLTYTAVGFDMQ